MTNPSRLPKTASQTLLIVGVLLLCTTWGVLRAFPSSGDEFAYLFQANAFAHGELNASGFPESVRPFFEVDHIINGPALAAKYPPGWPLLLVPGTVLGVPWATSILMGLVFLWSIVRIAAHLGESSTLAVVAGAASPFFLLNAASYHSHMPALTLYALGVMLLMTDHSWRGTTLSGLCWAIGFLVRPYDAAILALTIPLLLSGKRLPLWASVACLGPLAFGVYNQLQFGAWWRTGYAAYKPTFARLYPGEGAMPEPSLSNLVFIPEHLAWLSELWVWAAAPLILGLIGLSRLRLSNRKDNVLLWCAVSATAVVASSFLTKPFDGDSYGPRYLHAVLLPLTISAGYVPGALESVSAQLKKRGAAALMSLLLLTSIDTFAQSARVVRENRAVFVAADAAPASKKIILIENGEPHAAHWYARNLSPDDDVLFARDLGREHWPRLREAYPDHTLYAFVRTASEQGRLVRLPVR